MKKFIIRLLLFIGIIIVIGFFSVPILKDTKFGLDLQGGFEVLYEISPIEGDKLTADMLNATHKTISRRIDVLGVSEPDIIIEGDNRIRVKLAGVKDVKQARDILSKAATLTFRDTNDNLLMTSSVLKGGNAKVTSDSKGQPAVLLPVVDVEKFYQVTNKVKDMNDNRIVIWLDYVEGEDSFLKEANNCGNLTTSKCLSAAYVDQAFASDVTIEGNFQKEEASLLVELINSGSLPTKLTEISSRMVGASFGEESLSKTSLAGLIGVILIIACLTYFYRFAGFIAGLGIIIYTFLTFLVFWSIGGVLTLPGIASLILGIGMAVDANILSFERIKEELYKGNSLKRAYKAGNESSFRTIMDANITTLLVAIILFFLGESSVKGFATMLIISIFITIIVMVFVIKYIIELFVKTDFFDKRLNLFIGVKESDLKDKKIKESKLNPYKSLDFMHKPNRYVLISASIILTGLIFIIMSGLNLGIDYRGGTNITILSSNNINSKEIKEDAEVLKLDYNEINNINDNTAYIKLNDVLTKEESEPLNKYFTDKYDASVDIGVVSNIVKKELTKNAIIAVVLSLIGMIIYVSFRFRFTFAIASISALLHDVLIMFAIFAIFRLEIDVIYIAAVLAIIGYSVNDTIVIFDRIRETVTLKHKNIIPNKEVLKSILNESLRAVLKRSILITVTVLLAVISLIIFGSVEILNFNIAILIGLIAGVYSSVLLAPYVWYLLELRNIGKKVDLKEKYKDKYEELVVKGIND